MNRILPLSLGAAATALVVAAPVVAFGLAPALTQLPDDADTERSYAGSFSTLLNAAALAGGEGPVLLADLAATVEKHVTVQDTDGDAAALRDANVFSVGGAELTSSTITYAVDRKDLDGTDPSGLEGDLVEPTGQTVSWPFDAQKSDYDYWVPDIAASIPAVYDAETEIQGLDVYTYVASTPARPIVDATVLAGFPASLPKTTIAALAGEIDLSDAQREQLDSLLAVLPDEVALSYTYSGTTIVQVEPRTGMVIDSTRSETRVASIAATESTPAVPLTPVWDLTFASTPDSVETAVADAEDARGRITLIGTTVPIVLLGLGLLLAGLTGVVLVRAPGKKDLSDGGTQESVTAGTTSTS